MEYRITYSPDWRKAHSRNHEIHVSGDGLVDLGGNAAYQRLYTRFLRLIHAVSHQTYIELPVKAMCAAGQDAANRENPIC